jgi:hypothetical protein
MLEEMTGINRETVHKISVEGLKKEKVCACFVPHLLMQDQKHQRAASSVEFVEMIHTDRNFVKRIVMDDESWCFMYVRKSVSKLQMDIELKQIRVLI